MIRPSHHLVVFLKQNRARWFDVFMGWGPFNHVLTLSSFEDGYVLFNWQGGHADLAVMSRRETSLWLCQMRANHQAVHFHVAVDHRAPPHRMPFLYCVESVKQLIGLRCWWAVTPSLLYHALIERGLEASPHNG